MEVAGLVLGTLGIAGLFKSCIENFDIVVRAKDFSEEFDLLCAKQIRLVIWGETLGLVSNNGTGVGTHPALERPDIRPAIEANLYHLRNLLSKADVITGRYEANDKTPAGDALESSSKGMVIFRSQFDKFKARLRQNQKQTSTWKVTRWSVHDYDQFRKLITDITEILDGLERVTSALKNGLLERQQAVLIEEIQSLSDTESLRLLQVVSSNDNASSSKDNTSSMLKAISDSASLRMLIIEHSGTRTISSAPSQSFCAEAQPTLETGVPSSSTQQEPSFPQDPGTQVPQHQRWMASLASQRDSQPREPRFTSGDVSYGLKLKPIKEADEEAWTSGSATLLYHADKGSSLAQRAFVELRAIRRANVPFISAALAEDRLDCLVASIEGPPDTPYEGGIFWLTVKLTVDKPPMLRFQTRIYHPNVDCNGKLCANYQDWWNDENLRAYMGTIPVPGRPWFSENRNNSYSLGAVLVAICGLLAHPNVDDPLVPEIAATYITDYSSYVQAARLYTTRYALDRNAPKDLVFADEEQEPSTEPIFTTTQPKTQSVMNIYHGVFSSSSMEVESDFADLERGEAHLVFNRTSDGVEARQAFDRARRAFKRAYNGVEALQRGSDKAVDSGVETRTEHIPYMGITLSDPHRTGFLPIWSYDETVPPYAYEKGGLEYMPALPKISGGRSFYGETEGGMDSISASVFNDGEEAVWMKNTGLWSWWEDLVGLGELRQYKMGSGEGERVSRRIEMRFRRDLKMDNPSSTPT
ncbi:hypothetical protein QBC47DRAFT_357538 [Echria macrotheca]|uniref:UBC core domain-containing protein n=1 Tax=Echria macrotheca TaxID=438768 RepID=A0AAJ0BK16_9PEZI|nr:hypothetical protein QBC47DRAFT_357538 [Echria macrotheca]